ncbi:MAG: DNA replication and repair protein RecF [Chthoniobacterales bacterium]
MRARVNQMLSRLSLRDFRCFRNLDIEFDPEITCIVGQNATGKTSLLEAVAVLIQLQSPRASSLREAIRFGARGLVVDGHVSGYHLQFYYGATRRKLALDGVAQQMPDAYLDIYRAVYFGNSDIELVRGNAEARRRFLDFAGSQLFANYREILRSYQKALRSRNAFLKMVPTRPREVAAYAKPLLKFGHQLMALRAFLVERLEPGVVSAFSSVSDRGEAVTLKYQPGATNDFENELAKSAGEEQRLKTTLIGPHRDDLQMLVQGKPAELFASEGQQRTIAIAVKLAQAQLLEARIGKPPILLLDDVFGELDPGGRNRLMANLPKRGQRLVTTTSFDWLSEIQHGRLGRLRASEDGDRILEAVS